MRINDNNVAAPAAFAAYDEKVTVAGG